MIRNIIKIDETACNGCGLCAKACHEGAIGMVDGKARLLRDDYCDGLGDCLPTCPTGAITFVEREAAAYDEAAVLAARAAKEESLPCGCPGSACQSVQTVTNCLGNFPVQIKLMPPNAPYLDNGDLLIAADCTAYAYGNFHRDFMKNRVTLIGCPKLDAVDYSEKLTRILVENDIKSVKILRMEVPCCGGLENAAKRALQKSGKFIPWQVITISTDGKILD